MSADLKRTIGYTTAVSLVVGSIIGSGIFMRPAEMAGLLGSPYLILAAWIITGVFVLCSAMVFAEIGAMFPETGGHYIYMQKMYGDFWAYLVGWASFAVINTAGTAAIAFIFSQYFEYFITLPRFSPATEHSVVWSIPMVGEIFPLENFGVKLLTIVVLGILSLIAYFSTNMGGAIQRFLTFTKVIAITLLTCGLFFSGKGEFQHFITNDEVIKPVGFALLAAFVAACNGALQAYDGSQVMLNIGGEIKDPKRNIPRSLIIGIIICMIVYILITSALIYILPMKVMAASSLVASDAAFISFGVAGGGIIAALICLNVLGSTNANVYTPPRMSFAMAKNHQFFSAAGVIHKKYRTPGNAILIHFSWMVILTLSGSFYVLADMYIFVVWIFNMMMIAGVFILRKRMPDAERPYKVWGYPFLPAIVLLFTVFFLGMTLYNDIHNYIIGKAHVINSLLGLIITALGIPLYFYFKRKKDRAI